MTDRTPGSPGAQPDEPQQPDEDNRTDRVNVEEPSTDTTPEGLASTRTASGHSETTGVPVEPVEQAQPSEQATSQQASAQHESWGPTQQFPAGAGSPYQAPGAPGSEHTWPHYPGTYPQGMAGVQTAQRSRGVGRMFAGVIAIALATALVGGGIGGYFGYRLGREYTPGPSALDQPLPARSTSTQPTGSVAQVAQKVLPSVVELQAQSMQGQSEGSGIVLSPDGYILTNNHVAEAAQQGRMTASFHDNRTASVHLIGRDPNSDLAVVKADNINGLTPAELGRSDDMPVGAPVVAIGSPFGLSGTVTSGIISAKDRPVRAGGESGAQTSVLNALQTDAAINPGNSGGPLVDMDGRVVGINSAIYSPSSGQEQAGSVGLGFSIPIDQARRTAKELMDTGSATQTTLGVQITAAPSGGALVHSSVPGGPADHAGIKPGDVITKLDDRVIRDPDSLIAAVRSHNPGDRVRITLSGNGPDRTVDVTLAGQKGSS